MFSRASSSVSPCELQPGRPGQETLYPSSECCRTTRYFIHPPIALATTSAMPRPTILRVDRHPLHAAIGVQHSFRQRRMRVDRKHHLFDGRFEFEGSNCFGDQFGSLRPDDVDAEDLAMLRIGHDLDEAFVRADDRGLGVRREVELTDL